METAGVNLHTSIARAIGLLAKWALRRAERTAEPGEVVATGANSLVVK
jgi:hypothetical protein